MKVLFLDVDGCINNWKSRNDFIGMEPTLVARLARIVKETDCKIVVSSAWRIGGLTKGSLFYDEMEKADSSGLILPNVIGRTIDDTSCDRGYEIQEWLYDNPGYTKVVILDDIEINPPQGGTFTQDNVFSCETDVGITENTTDMIIAYLKKE